MTSNERICGYCSIDHYNVTGILTSFLCGRASFLKSMTSMDCHYLHYGFPYFLPESFFKGDCLDPDDGDRVGFVS